MELSSRPRHQIRAQGRRRGQAGIVIVENEISRVKWHPGSDRGGATSTVIERKKGARGSLELLEFLSRTAVQSSKEILADLDEPKVEPDSSSLNEFRRIIANVQKSDRSAFRSLRTNFADGSRPGSQIIARRVDHSGPAATRAGSAAHAGASASSNSLAASSESAAAAAKRLASGSSGANPPASDASVSSVSVDFVDNLATSAADASASAFASLVEYHSQKCVEKQTTPATEGDVSGSALRGLLKELNDWLSADTVTAEASSESARYVNQFSNAQPSNQPEAIAPSRTIEHQPLENLIADHQDSFRSKLGFEQVRDWNYSLARKIAEGDRTKKRSRGKLSPLLASARRMVIGVRNLPLGRRIESHENGAILEKDELGRVTQIRASCGEIISIYYGRDGAPEGFVRTDAKGVLHSVAECDAQGVVLRDEGGRVRAAGESLSIDPQGRISISRADGQYWSIDLARQMLSEKRRLSDPTGKWTALTAVFAADGFRMMTLFQALSPELGSKAVRSHDDASRIWSSAAVESGHFRFYGRDGSSIEFGSEEGLVNLAPVHVSSPGVRPIEPRWRSKHQAGTAWQSVHEYVVSYLVI